MAKSLDSVGWVSVEAASICVYVVLLIGKKREEKRRQERRLARRGGERRGTTEPGESLWVSTGVCDIRVLLVITGLWVRVLGQVDLCVVF